MSGLFITFEGGEGTGKSTQLALLSKHLRSNGLEVRLLREPGGTIVGERVRSILLDRKNSDISPIAELMLYEACRAQSMHEIIKPGLDAGEIILCDRFTDSTVAYQGYGRGLGAHFVRELNNAATAGISPDRTCLFMLDPKIGVRRAAKVSKGGADRLESAPMQFHENLASGFLEIAKQEPNRVRLIDASGSIEEVQQLVWEQLGDLFNTIPNPKKQQ